MIKKSQTYQGILNPSGGVALDNQHFLVADDEDNTLRIYHCDETDKPVQTIQLSHLFDEIEDGEDLEIDLEGATTLNETIFMIGSHSTSRKGKYRPARHRLLAIKSSKIESESAKENNKSIVDTLLALVKTEKLFNLSPQGAIYTSLIADLDADSRFKDYKFDKAQKIAPKEPGGLSIEGLSSTPEGSLLIGFRNPLSKKDLALIVELLNPFEILQGRQARFGNPIELDLQSFGIREITWRKEQNYLIIAGPYHANKKEDEENEIFQLYEWQRDKQKLITINAADLTGYNLETAIFYPGAPDEVQLLSDDGKVKKAEGFRSLWVTLPS